MGRNHVHFAKGLPGSFQRSLNRPAQSNENVEQLPDSDNVPMVVSGMRTSSSLLIFIDLKKALQGGLKFWTSQNGVVLSEGNEQSIVPIDFFESVQDLGRDKSKNSLLMEGGKEVNP